MDVRELDIDLIDRINPFGEAYAILAKAMTEERLRQYATVISAKRTALLPEEAKDLAARAGRVQERSRTTAVGNVERPVGAAHGQRSSGVHALQTRGAV